MTNYSIPEGEEDLAKAVQMVQEQATDTQRFWWEFLNNNQSLLFNSDLSYVKF